MTIGIPVYNGERYLAEAVESVLAQTFVDFEIVISDNASTDGTRLISEEFARIDERVRYVRNERNVGAARNFSRVVELARGKYFKWLCHDDFIGRDFLSVCVPALERQPCAVTASPDTVVVDSCRRVIRTLRAAPSLPPTSGDPVSRYRTMMEACLAEQRQGGTRRLFEKYVYGLHRTARLRHTRLLGAYVESDLVLAVELALVGDIVEINDQLCFLRFLDTRGTNQMNFLTGDWRAVQHTIDPTATAPASVLLSRGRRFHEHVAAVLLSQLPLRAKCRALPTALQPLIQRASARLGRRHRGS